ncbi:MAG: FecR domain-containing protein [Chitinophagaceae bacterium]|nr:FecR domain-containing protein [Chitinophagaceae bacterium]
MSNEAQFQETLQKALAGRASEEELRWLVEKLKHDEQFALTEEMAAILAIHHSNIPVPGEAKVNSMVNAILDTDKLEPTLPIPSKAPVFTLWKKITVAAAIAAIAFGAYFFWPADRSGKTGITDNSSNQLNDINPGNNKARLILADGSQVLLDSIANGLVQVQGQTRIAKEGEGQLTYEMENSTGANPKSEALLYNTIVVPRGGQYQLVLADGSRVWLNAASQLRYPVAFTGKDRIVELEGEGYFEVSPDASKPFFVQTNTASVRVLGTRFNVSAYASEDWKTTLLEGKVSVTSGPAQPSDGEAGTTGSPSSFILQPGQQAIIAGSSAINSPSSKIDVTAADIDETIAWKEGYFHFTAASVKNIMAQVSRWYDVDIVYKDTAASNTVFNGRINRSIRLSGIVNALKQGGINCSIQQKRLLVYP